MSFLGNLASAILGPVLGGVLHGNASNIAANTAEQAYQDEQNALEIADLQHQTQESIRMHHFNQVMDVASEDAKESTLMQNYVITLEDADKKETEKLMSQISQTTG